MPHHNKVQQKQSVNLKDYLGAEQKQCYAHVKDLVEEGDRYNEFTKKENFLKCIIGASYSVTSAEFLTQRAFRFGILTTDYKEVLSRVRTELNMKLQNEGMTEDERANVKTYLEQVDQIEDSLVVFKILKENAAFLDIAKALVDEVKNGEIAHEVMVEILAHISVCEDQHIAIRNKAMTVMNAVAFYETLLLSTDVSDSNTRKALRSINMDPETKTEMLIGIAINPQKYDPKLREKAISLIYLDWEQYKPGEYGMKALFHAFETGDMDLIPSTPLILSQFVFHANIGRSDDQIASSIVSAIKRTVASAQILRKMAAKYERDMELFKRGLLSEEPQGMSGEWQIKTSQEFIKKLVHCLANLDPDGKLVESIIGEDFKKEDEGVRMAIIKAIPFLSLNGENPFNRLKRILLDKSEVARVKDEAFESMTFIPLSPEEVRWCFEYAHASAKDLQQLTASLFVVFERLIDTPARKDVLQVMDEMLRHGEADEVTKARMISILRNVTVEDEGAEEILFKIATTTSADDVFMSALSVMKTGGITLDEKSFARLLSAAERRPIFYRERVDSLTGNAKKAEAREDEARKTDANIRLAVRCLNAIRPAEATPLTVAALGGVETEATVEAGRGEVQSLDPKRMNDRAYAIECVRKSGMMIQYFNNFSADLEIARLAVQEVYNAYGLLSQEAQRDPQVREIVRKKVAELAASPWPEIALSDDAIRVEDEFVLEAIKVNADLLKLAGKNLQGDNKFLVDAFTANFNVIALLDKISAAKLWQHMIGQLHASGRHFPPEMEGSYGKFSVILLDKYKIDVRRYNKLSDIHERFKTARKHAAVP